MEASSRLAAKPALASLKAIRILRRVIVLLLFFCSGATALIYEVLWSKQLGLMLGSTIQAQTVVLAAYMGGLALGNRLVGARADLLIKPLRAYGWVEIGIGIYAFFFQSCYSAADALFAATGGRLLSHSGWLLLWKAVLAGSLVLVPTVLMGGTLPLIAAWLRRQESDGSRLSARFYAVNSLGAVAGAWLGGFFLVQALGVLASMQLAALVNVLIGGTALGLARRSSAPAARTTSAEAAAAVEAANVPVRAGRAVWLVAFTGAVSMGLEVLATRSLGLIFGPSLQAFALVLMAFILGIGLGSWWVSAPGWSGRSGARWAPWFMVAAAALMGAYVYSIEGWVVVYSHLRHGLAANETGYVLHQVVAAGMALMVLGLPAGLLGAVLPLSLREADRGARGLAHEVGRLLTWNTLGAVVGTLVVGFVLMPGVGLRGGFLALAGTLCVAVVVGGRSGPPGARWTALGVGLAIVALALGSSDVWRHALGSGIYRARQAPATHARLEQRRRTIQYQFYQDAPDATVCVESIAGAGSDRELVLRINGKPDASTRGDLSTQYLLAHLPLLARPEAQEVFVLGFGSGITAGAVLSHPVRRLTVAENCRPVLQAGALFARWNRDVLTQPRTRVFDEDARTLLKLDPTRYDVIISEPSNPWVAGIGGVFSREFYELAASRLAEGGVMAQWFHIYEMHDGIVEMVLRTFGSVFPSMEIWESADTDIILLGSLRPWPATAAHYQKSFDRPLVRADLAAIDLRSPEALLARQLASQRTAFAVAGEGGVQSDAFPVLEYEAPRAFYIGATARRLFEFDERTRQASLAPPEKKQAGEALSQAALREIFRQFPSGSPRFRQVLLNGAGASRAVLPEQRLGLFPALLGVPAEPTAEPSLLCRRTLADLALLGASEQNRAAAVEDLRSLLQRAVQMKMDEIPGDWSAGETALRAAAEAVSARRGAEVEAWLDWAGRLGADAGEVGYLRRIHARWSGGVAP